MAKINRKLHPHGSRSKGDYIPAQICGIGTLHDATFTAGLVVHFEGHDNDGTAVTFSVKLNNAELLRIQQQHTAAIRVAPMRPHDPPRVAP